MIIGITGCPGAGKSVAAMAIAACGFARIDADTIGREVVESDPDVIKRLAGVFGEDILMPDGMIDRRLTGQRAFASPESTAVLNSIVHPVLLAQLKHLIDYNRAESVNTVVDCALIFEWNIEDWFDVVVCVHALPEIRTRRLMDRDRRTQEDIEHLFSAQLPEEVKIRRSDIALANNGPQDRLKHLAQILCEYYRE